MRAIRPPGSMDHPATVPPDHDRLLDVGDTLCGELAVLLRAELGRLAPGQVVKLVARDSAAPADIPAWCRMTGHPLLREEHPDYWIRRRAD